MTRPPRAATLVLGALLLVAPSRAFAANILFVADTDHDQNIVTVLTGEGHTVTTVTGDFSSGDNPALRGSLSAYDVVYWTASGDGFGDSHTNPAVFSNLTAYVNGGGRVFVTGYDSVASPTDALLIEFLGGSSSRDVPADPGPLTTRETSLTTGVVDIRGVTPTGGSGDRDALTGLAGGAVAVEGTTSESQWILRTLGAGEIAYVSNGDSGSSPHGSWASTAAGGAGAYNAAIRNFASGGFPTAPCVGLAEGAACTTSGGPGVCHDTRCCTGCWDGARCHVGGASAACGAGGGACLDCADGDLCTSDVCSAGACSNPFAPAGTRCEDGVFCTAFDTCDGAGVCTGTGDTCADRNECTTDSCDEELDRCDNAPLPEHTACSAFGAPGVCRAGGCCNGCFDGTSCRPGTGSAQCGAGGGDCASCVDGDSCTQDVCSSGACSNPLAAAGTRCDDGLFCTATDACDASGACVGSGARCDDLQSCTADMCDESLDRCVFTRDSGCVIGGECVDEGAGNPTYPCLVCDSSRSDRDWSPRAVGGECRAPLCTAGRVLTYACDEVGACAVSAPTPCPSGACADSERCAAGCAVDSDCASGERCDMSARRCEALRPVGSGCAMAEQCESGACVDRVCCASACDGECERCDVAGSVGTCGFVPVGDDPDDECPGECNGDGACAEVPDAGPTRPRDAGADAGALLDASMVDASVEIDAGGPDEDPAGCSCRATGSSKRAPGALGLVVLAVILGRRRRGRARSRRRASAR